MPDPIATQLINCAWPAIEAAVTAGLALTGPYGTSYPTLDTVAVVSKEKPSQVKDWRHQQAPGTPPHVRVEKSENVFDIIHYFGLTYHELHSPDTDAIKNWAEAARRFELDLALRQYALAAARHSYRPDDLYQADPAGWGPRRCVVFNSGAGAVPDTWKRADLERTVKVGVDSANGVQALVFRTAGGPYVRRPDGLSLGWTPAGHCGAELLLTEQLEFRDVTAKTIYGIEMIP